MLYGYQQSDSKVDLVSPSETSSQVFDSSKNMIY